MAEQPDQSAQLKPSQIVVGIGGILLMFNAAFFVASKMWSGDHPDADLAQIRIAFLAMTAIVAVAGAGAVVAPRVTGHVLALLIGLGALVAGIASFGTTLTGVLGVTLLIVGLVMPALAHFSFRRSRPAWSFLMSLLAVLATVTFFGAPKVRGLLHVGLWTALILPGLMIIAVIALAAVRDEYHAD